MKKQEPRSAKTLRIGELAAKSGCSVPTLRYYEAVGLLGGGVRSASGQRMYDASAIERAGFIRRCRGLGFGLEQIRALVSFTDGRERACLEAREVAAEHLKAVRGRMVDLMALERSLSRYVDACGALCADGPAPGCTILKDLGLAAEGATDALTCCR
jgi:MerR family copper efflux transcriptional regulator